MQRCSVVPDRVASLPFVRNLVGDGPVQEVTSMARFFFVPTDNAFGVCADHQDSARDWISLNQGWRAGGFSARWALLNTKPDCARDQVKSCSTTQPFNRACIEGSRASYTARVEAIQYLDRPGTSRGEYGYNDGTSLKVLSHARAYCLSDKICVCHLGSWLPQWLCRYWIAAQRCPTAGLTLIVFSGPEAPENSTCWSSSMGWRG